MMTELPEQEAWQFEADNGSVSAMRNSWRRVSDEE